MNILLQQQYLKHQQVFHASILLWYILSSSMYSFVSWSNDNLSLTNGCSSAIWNIDEKCKFITTDVLCSTVICPDQRLCIQEMQLTQVQAGYNNGTGFLHIQHCSNQVHRLGTLEYLLHCLDTIILNGVTFDWHFSSSLNVSKYLL